MLWLRILLAALASQAIAAPHGYTTRRAVSLPRYFHPNSVAGNPTSPGSRLTKLEPLEVVKDYLKSEFGIGATDYVVTGMHKSQVGVTHVHVAQVMNGLPASNAVANFNIGTAGEVISMYHSFIPRASVGSAKLSGSAISADRAVHSFAIASGLPLTDKLTVTQAGDGFIVSGASFAIEPIKAKEVYYQTEAGLVRAWEMSINMPDLWQDVFVDALTGAVVGVATWTSDWTESYENIAALAAKGSTEDLPTKTTKSSKLEKRDILPATYGVVPIGKTDPVDSGGLQTLVSPWDLNASPDGWHVVNDTQFYEVRGNNVIAQANPNNVFAGGLPALPRPNSTTLDFEYTLDVTKAPSDPQNQAVSVVNVFYIANTMHDLYYNYGFDEAAGNFQAYNYDKGGSGNDAVLANAQDSFGANNANFATPVDGSPGHMRVALYTYTTPNRDSGLANEIVAHEMTHGLTNRLTGGPANSNCLQDYESGGLAEGWSDAFALFVTLHDDADRNGSYPSGVWLRNKTGGFRTYPYSTDMTVNNMTYADIQKQSEVHFMGTIWTTVMNEILWNMVDISGRTPTAQIIANHNGGTGNTDLIKILIQSFKMQPCNPTFLQAKQAMLDAEALLFGGMYACAIHAGFAKRGMGRYASVIKINDFNLPVQCGGADIPPPTQSPIDYCSHSVCKSGGPLIPDCNECAIALCSMDKYCCKISWDSTCVAEVKTYCSVTC
ncbi:Fungalysin metallopeptidase-domain-containing protein [Cladochytrium replicatum]|nr:Fungalysin metallopeptidase-domain-containing protein [Cladochytrium replicatum]